MDLVTLFNGPIGVWILVAILVVVSWLRSSAKGREQRAELDQIRKLVSQQLEDRIRLPQAAKRCCETCKFWDHEEGQAQLRAHPTFFQAAQYVTPAMMTRRAELVSDDGTPKFDDADDKPKVPFKSSWEDVGACSQENEGTFKDYVCDKYEARS